MGWTTERPTEAGNYYYGHRPPEMVNVVRLFEQSGDWFVMYLEDGLTLPATHACGYWGPRIPSPDHLAALLRLAEAARKFNAAGEEVIEANNSSNHDALHHALTAQDDAQLWLNHVAIKFAEEAGDDDALDAVREAQAK